MAAASGSFPIGGGGGAEPRSVFLPVFVVVISSIAAKSFLFFTAMLHLVWRFSVHPNSSAASFSILITFIANLEMNKKKKNSAILTFKLFALN